MNGNTTKTANFSDAARFGRTLSSPAAKSENQAAKTDKMNTAFCGQVERLVVAKLNRLRRDSCARKYLQQRRNAENAETQKLPERNHACRAEAQTLHENKNAAPPKRRRAKFTRKTKASTATPQNRFKHAARFATTTKLTRRRKRRLGARHERKAGAVGGRVQRLVVAQLEHYAPRNNSLTSCKDEHTR